MIVQELLQTLEAHADPINVAGMARFGIASTGTLGVSIPIVRRLAKTFGHEHQAALELWDSGIHEARILAALVDKPAWVTEEQMEAWVADFDSWDVCDQVCSNLFDKTPFAYAKAAAWAERQEEFVRRAGFALMAALSVHDKTASNQAFLAFLPLIERQANDGRNFVKKAVNWALRQIGKRNAALLEPALALAETLSVSADPSSRWVGKDAARELRLKRSSL